MTKYDKIYFILMEISVVLTFAFYTVGIEKLKYEYPWVIALIILWILFDLWAFNKEE